MKKLILLLLFLIAACATSSKYETKLNSWLNRPRKELILDWGIPTKTYKVDSHTELLEYKTSHKVNKNTFTCKTTFTLIDGKVSDWKWQGNNCVSN